MAIPSGPASRPRTRKDPNLNEVGSSAAAGSATAAPPRDAAPPRELGSSARESAATAPSGERPAAERPRRDTARASSRIPSEILPRHEGLSPALLGLTLAEFLELLYQDALQPGDLTVEELFRMRDTRSWPDAFPAGDPRALFTEDMCRRGQFVPIGWHPEGISFATHKDEAAQDALASALDLLVKMPVTLYTVAVEQVELGITWLFRRE